MWKEPERKADYRSPKAEVAYSLQAATGTGHPRAPRSAPGTNPPRGCGQRRARPRAPASLGTDRARGGMAGAGPGLTAARPSPAVGPAPAPGGSAVGGRSRSPRPAPHRGERSHRTRPRQTGGSRHTCPGRAGRS